MARPAYPEPPVPRRTALGYRGLVGWTIDAVREGDADPAAVWRLYADPATWSQWGHNATWAHAEGPLVQGGTVDVRANYGTVYHCRIRRLEEGRALELVVKPAGLTIINVYEVTPTDGGGCRVRHAFEVSGPLATPTRWIGLGRLYRRQLAGEVEAVIALAKDPASIDPSRTPAPVSRPERVWHGIGRRLRGGRERQRR
jgi:uncharacterized protein YndB with AHSA1/START domain